MQLTSASCSTGSVGTVSTTSAAVPLQAQSTVVTSRCGEARCAKLLRVQAALPRWRPCPAAGAGRARSNKRRNNSRRCRARSRSSADATGAGRAPPMLRAQRRLRVVRGLLHRMDERKSPWPRQRYCDTALRRVLAKNKRFWGCFGNHREWHSGRVSSLAEPILSLSTENAPRVEFVVVVDKVVSEYP